MERRFFLQCAAMTAASALVRWRFAGPAPAQAAPGLHDVIIIGAGLGGLSCAAHLARNGFKVLLLEQHYRLGGYATSFPRHGEGLAAKAAEAGGAGGAGAFTCEVSLHASALAAPGTKSMLQELGVWDSLELVPHKHAWCSHFPDFSFEIPHKAGLDGFEHQLTAVFPNDAQGIAAYFDLWRKVMREVAALDAQAAHGPTEASGASQAAFPTTYPALWAIRDKSVGQLVDAHITNPRVQAVLTQSCGYYGLPPSTLSAFFYLVPTGEYLEFGGAYLKGTSQSLSNALGAAIKAAGGTVRTHVAVDSILVEQGRAVGVTTSDGQQHRARAVVCNASAPQLLESLLPEGSLPAQARTRLEAGTPSPGCCIVWLGLNQDITKTCPTPEQSFYAGLDPEQSFAASLKGEYERVSCSMMVYDNLVPGFSPPGCSTLCIMCLSGYDPWQRFELDYLADRKEAYLQEKRRVADLLIQRVEQLALPGLSQMIVMREESTPLTNLRFTGNTYGSIYGYAPTVDNAFMTRLPNAQALPGLFLASAWGNPGGGFAGALLGGKGAFRDVATYLAG
ncbi:phytoene desaturase family protein [Megalodesulfovibrio paquesii]